MTERKRTNRSSWFRTERMFDLDQIGNWPDYVPTGLWPSEERPADPMAYRIRKLMEYLTPAHREALEDKYFLEKSTAEMARERECTERAVRGLLERARKNLVRVIAEHGDEVTLVPEEEL